MTSATADDGRNVDYRYSSGRLASSVRGDRQTTYGYEAYNRLTSYGSYRSYTYDAWNNLLSVSSSNGVGEAPNYTLTYATNASGAPATNRINNSGYTYDNAGNVTNDGSLAYAYDAAGRLKTAGTNNSCEYDGDGLYKTRVNLLPLPETEAIRMWINGVSGQAHRLV